jgi:hypothetical protein
LLGLFPPYFDCIILNVIGIETVISPSLLGLFPLYFDCISRSLLIESNFVFELKNLIRRFPAPKRNEQPNATILFLFHSWICLAFARFFRVDQSATGQETEPLFLDHYRGIGDESFFAWCRGI